MIETIEEHACFGGRVGIYRHDAPSTACAMRYSVFVPPQAAHGPVPVVTWLAGLTCTEETFMIKAGAQRVAALLGLMLVAPDTSPRGAGIPGEGDDWDFGTGAGFYVDATEEPWSTHYNTYSYVSRDLPDAVFANFPGDRARQGLFGHSMGGHGALVIGLRNPQTYRSLSAFAPISSAMRCPWGEKALTGYLGPDRANWRQYDAAELLAAGYPRPVLVDQGLADQFLESQLHPHLLEQAAAAGAVNLVLRRHAGYDHGYYFIQSFIEDHLRHHAALLGARP